MKTKSFVCTAALLLASLSATQAQTVIVQWNFENEAITNYDPNPTPNINNCVGAVLAEAIGMDVYPTPGVGTNDPDILQGTSGDTGANGITNYTQIWRVRANGAGNGWSSAATPGTQGAQINMDTTGFTNVMVSFDWYLTKRGEANLQLEYTTDGNTWSNLPITIPAAESGSSLQFVDNTADSDPNSVQGYYVNCLPTSGGQQWFTNLTATISDPAAANDPNFGLRMVNASTGSSCVDGTGTALNNSSGNWRFDNITISGTSSGAVLTPPTITPSPIATVDGPFTNTFPNNNNWIGNITSVKVNGTQLTAGYAFSAGKLVFTPAASVPANLLQTAGSANVSIAATGYSVDSFNQYIAPGVPKQLVITSEPLAPTGNGGTLVQQPALEVFDQYNNVATNCSATYTATPSSGWSFGIGSGTMQLLTNGIASFTNLSATVNGSSAVSGATITFTASGASGLGSLPYTTTNSSAFNIPAPPATGFARGDLAVLQEDMATKNSTFSILELRASGDDQASPVDVFPISATGTNALRQSSAGSTGRLSDSEDGTLVCFTGFQDGSSATADEATVDPRAAGTLNAAGAFVLQAHYTGLGDTTGNQTRSAATLDSLTWYMGDKGGVYTNSQFDPNNPYIGGPNSNVRSLKSFGGTVYALQQAGGTQPTVLVLAELYNNGGAEELYPLDGFPVDNNVVDFYLVQSGHNGNMYDTAYYIDTTNTTSGTIFKYYFSGYDDNGIPMFSSAGSWPTPNGGDGLCAATNASGGVDIYYTTGSGGTASNSVVKLHDSATWNAPINVTTVDTLYTADSVATLKGIAFAPVLAVTVSPPKLNGTNLPSGFQITFTNVPGISADLTVWSTTNIALPFASWSNLGHPTETANGSYSTYLFLDSVATSNPKRFYRVTSP